MIIRYLDYVERFEYELIQRKDEGLDVSVEEVRFADIQSKIQKLGIDKLQEEAREILHELSSKPNPQNLALHEPDELAEIRNLLAKPQNSSIPAIDPDVQFDAILGGWLGRAGGCLLGKPIEKYHRTVIREMLESNGSWPLNHYFTQKGMPKSILEKYPWKRRWGLESLRENIQCMPEDDDLNFTMLNLHVLESFGPSFSGEDIGTTWLTKLPVYEVFTAERVAYHNLLNGLSPPVSATTMNPFREWIGAQIRADLWGYVCPGDPQKAAEFAWRDARMTHVRSGIYGEMFFAAVMAAAFTEHDMRKLISIGLAQVPPRSRFAAAIEFVLDLPLESIPWEAVLDRLYEAFGHYHWVHTINNAALTVAALLYGRGDYEKTITHAVMGGWDTDCNGATAGSIIGIISGAKKLPGKWIDPLKNQVRSSLGGFDNSKFTDLAQRTQAVSLGANTLRVTSPAADTDDY